MTCRHPFSFPRSFTHTLVHTQTAISITHTAAAAPSHTPVFWYFSGIYAPRPVVRLLWRSVCSVYGQWHAQALWGLNECEHCHKRLAASVLVCVRGVSWLVGRHQYRWGLQKRWMSWLGLLPSSWVSIKKSPAAAVQTKPSSPSAPPTSPLSPQTHTRVILHEYHKEASVTRHIYLFWATIFKTFFAYEAKFQLNRVSTSLMWKNVTSLKSEPEVRTKPGSVWLALMPGQGGHGFDSQQQQAFLCSGSSFSLSLGGVSS